MRHLGRRNINTNSTMLGLGNDFVSDHEGVLDKWQRDYQVLYNQDSGDHLYNIFKKSLVRSIDWKTKCIDLAM